MRGKTAALGGLIKGGEGKGEELGGEWMGERVR